MKYLFGILTTLAIGIWVTGFFLGQRPDQRNYRALPDMYDEAGYDTQSANPVFADGKTQQPPVANTIRRGEMPLHYSADEQGAIRAGKELTSPIDSVTRANLQQGEKMYGDFCQPCHGVSGKGDGPVALRGYPRPPSLFLQNAMQMPDGRMFHVITYGQNNMPGYDTQIDRSDRWKTIAYIRDLQQQSQQDTTQ